MIYMLDACALMAYLAQEWGKGYEAIDELFARAAAGEIDIRMHIVNLTEVYYLVIQRCHSAEQADAIMQTVEDLPMEIVDITGPIYRETARMKAFYAMSLADAFACAAAKSFGAALVTRDKEIRAVEQRENLLLLWIQ